MAIKSIGYAYATSTYATRLGARSTGCYYVEVKACELSTEPRELSGPFDTVEHAEAFASAIGLDWSAYTRRAA